MTVVNWYMLGMVILSLSMALVILIVDNTSPAFWPLITIANIWIATSFIYRD